MKSSVLMCSCWKVVCHVQQWKYNSIYFSFKWHLLLYFLFKWLSDVSVTSKLCLLLLETIKIHKLCQVFYPECQPFVLCECVITTQSSWRNEHTCTKTESIDSCPQSWLSLGSFGANGHEKKYMENDNVVAALKR